MICCRPTRCLTLTFLVLVGTRLLSITAVRAQQPDPPQPSAEASADPTPTASDDSPLVMFPHGEWDRLWVSGQANFISQWHPAFHSPYQAKNSLTPEAQDASSRVLTLYTGLRLTSTTELLCDVQETGGHGVGGALGWADFFTLEGVRTPPLSKALYGPRLMGHKIFPPA